MTSQQDTELDQESEHALILETAYNLGYHKIKDGCLQEPLKELNKLISSKVNEERKSFIRQLIEAEPVEAKEDYVTIKFTKELWYQLVGETITEDRIRTEYKMKIQVKDYYTPLPPDRLKRHKELSDHWDDLETKED